MKSYLTISRLLAVLALSFAGVLAASSGANAAVRTGVSGQLHFESATPPPPGPSGCNSGYFCTYNADNGGDLCQQLNATSNLGAGCANENYGAFDNSSVGVDMFPATGEGGAYYFLGASDYLLDEKNDHFNQCLNGGSSCGDYMGVIWHRQQSVQFE
jgi:hypothetical protein